MLYVSVSKFDENQLISVRNIDTGRSVGDMRKIWWIRIHMLGIKLHAMS